MPVMTISEVSRAFNVSTRMLRYYEQIGLLPSLHKEDYSYRVYDEHSVNMLRQIIILRKLRISLKQISMIFNDKTHRRIVEVFQENIAELNGEITALRTIREISRRLISRLNESFGTDIRFELFCDADLISVIESLSLSKINFKEERLMDELNKANEQLTKLNDVRILHLPPFYVAASHYIGPEPEVNAGNRLIEYIKRINLYEVKPDARVFGFNHPNPSQGSPEYGYEFWVTIPEDMSVPQPLEKKLFNGGLFAAHCIKMGSFQEWDWLGSWVNKSPDYKPDYSDKGGEIMGGCLEEILNMVYNVTEGMAWPLDEMQIDLLLPVKKK